MGLRVQLIVQPREVDILRRIPCERSKQLRLNEVDSLRTLSRGHIRNSTWEDRRTVIGRVVVASPLITKPCQSRNRANSIVVGREIGDRVDLAIAVIGRMKEKLVPNDWAANRRTKLVLYLHWLHQQEG